MNENDYTLVYTTRDGSGIYIENDADSNYYELTNSVIRHVNLMVVFSDEFPETQTFFRFNISVVTDRPVMGMWYSAAYPSGGSRSELLNSFTEEDRNELWDSCKRALSKQIPVFSSMGLLTHTMEILVAGEFTFLFSIYDRHKFLDALAMGIAEAAGERAAAFIFDRDWDCRGNMYLPVSYYFIRNVEELELDSNG